MKNNLKKLTVLCLVVIFVSVMTFCLTSCDGGQTSSETTLDPNKPIGTLGTTTSDSVSETTTIIETTTATHGSTYPPATIPNITTNQTYASVTTAGTTTETTTPAPTTTKYYPVYTTRYPLYPVFTTTIPTTVATTTAVTTTETTAEETTTAETTTKNEIDLPWDEF